MNIIIITYSFPYSSGEQFLELELEYWQKEPCANVFIVPENGKGSKRYVPSNITVLAPLISSFYGFSTLLALAASLRLELFADIFREIAHMYQCNKLSLRRVLHSSAVALYVSMLKRILRKRLEQIGNPKGLYCYWNLHASYAAAKLKKECDNIKWVVVRAHRRDLYEDKNNCVCEYAPLKRQLLQSFDRFYPISLAGAHYLKVHYRICGSRIKTMRLGIAKQKGVSLNSSPGAFSIISISSCTSIKRIDCIIDALRLWAMGDGRNFAIQWSHIGGGCLFDFYKGYARQQLQLDRVNFQFVGQLNHKEVLKWYSDNPVDLFLNTSESEGIPVSIMEAMSFGVPIVAPNTGGISEILDEDTGLLLSETPSIEEIAAAINSVSKRRNTYNKLLIKQKIMSSCSSESNYTKFVQELMSLTETEYRP